MNNISEQNNIRFVVMRNEIGVQGLKDLIEKINLIRDTSEMNMIEIGSYIGESTLIFADYFKNVISIDPYVNDDYNKNLLNMANSDQAYDKFMSRIKNIMNIISFRVSSDEGSFILRNMKYDFVYIDGNCTYEQVKKDIINYLPLIKSNGFIGGHYYDKKHNDSVIKAVNEVLFAPDRLFKDSSWLKKISNIKMIA